MDVIIKKGVARGCITMPSSKSYAHRYLLGAMLASGTSRISNVFLNDDIKATLDCLTSFNTSFVIDNDLITVTSNDFNQNNHPVFPCRESGSTMRFIIPVALTKYDEITIKGSDRLLKRGIDLYEEIFLGQRIQIHKDLKENCIVIKGKLKSGHFKVRGDVSSQYITGLLFALPLLNGDSIIEVTTHLESKNYIDITIDVLKKYNIKIIIKDNVYYIPGRQKYMPCDNEVEGDYSNAAFLDAYNYLNGEVVIKNLNQNSLQQDKAYLELFKALNKEYREIDIKDVIDLGPVLFAFSALKNGAKFCNTKRLFIKESNRAEAMALELKKMNIDIQVAENEVIIKKGKIEPPKCFFASHNDHRLVMALCLFSCLFDITITNAEAVNKSFPSFFECLEKLGLEVEYVNR